MSLGTLLGTGLVRENPDSAVNHEPVRISRDGILDNRARGQLSITVYSNGVRNDRKQLLSGLVADDMNHAVVAAEYHKAETACGLAVNRG